jgi:DNA repair protein RadC
MVAHNHPSGSLTASREDKDLTKRINDAGKLLEIKLRDHLIIAIGPAGKADYFSFHDNAIL